MATTSDIKNGLCIKFNHDIYKIVEFLHVKPGKGPAFVRTKLKSLTNGKVLDNTLVIKVFKKLKQIQQSLQIGENLGNKNGMNLSGFKKVYISEATGNRGLASSIIGGATHVIQWLVQRVANPRGELS